MTNQEITETNNEELKKNIEICIDKFFRSIPYPQPSSVFSKKIKGIINDPSYNYYYPLVLVWEVISECNLRCKHCFFHDYPDSFKSNDDLSTEQALKVVDELAEMNILDVTLTGGEALLRKDLFQIISRLKSYNIVVKISTNATLITEEMAKRLREALAPDVDNIQISLDGGCKETHDKTRGEGNFDKSIQGIKNLVNNGIYPFVNCTATSYNVSEFADIFELAKKLKIKKLSIGKFRPCSENQKYLVPDVNTMFKSLANIILKEEQGNGPFFELRALDFFDLVNNEIAREILQKYADLPDLKEDVCNFNCQCHRHDKINISANGNVDLCMLVSNCKEFCLGNVKNDSLLDIWNSRHSNPFFNKRDSSKMICRKCKYITLCKGGCPAVSYSQFGNLYSPNKNCILGKELLMESTTK